MWANSAGFLGNYVFGELKDAGFTDRTCLVVLAGCYGIGSVIVSTLRIPKTAPRESLRSPEQMDYDDAKQVR